MSRVTKEKQTVFDWVDKNQRMISDFDQLIWGYAEPAWREYKSARAYCDLLKKGGFKVVEGTGEMPTAFIATYGEGKPVIATYAEYDAVPGTSQKQVPYRAPRDGLDQERWVQDHALSVSGGEPREVRTYSCVAQQNERDVPSIVGGLPLLPQGILRAAT